MLNLATATPLGVYLTSGSLPRFPMRITLFTLFAMRVFFLCRFRHYTSAAAFLELVSDAGSINSVQHYIHHHSCDRDIEPYRICPPRDAAVPVKFLAQSVIQGQYHQRNHRDSQQRMRNQDGEIYRPYPSLPWETD